MLLRLLLKSFSTSLLALVVSLPLAVSFSTLPLTLTLLRTAHPSPSKWPARLRWLRWPKRERTTGIWRSQWSIEREPGVLREDVQHAVRKRAGFHQQSTISRPF